jgi:alpha-L-rhamnosidase
MGEAYDATREAAIDGWSTAAYDDRSWKSAVRVELQGAAYRGAWRNSKADPADLDFSRLALVGQIGKPAKVYQVLTARSVKEARKGVFVYDMGQNLVGVPRISFKEGAAGQHVKLRVAEMLYPDLPASGDNVGMIMTENYRAALSQDEYIMKPGPQVFQPRFTFRGYQYLEITGIDAPLPLADVQALVISSVHTVTASYESSNPKVNKLWSNLVWSNIGNFLSIPTDCPQRNERLGWSGDLSVFARTATYVSDASSFLQRHLRSMRDVQEPSGRFTDVAPLGGGIGGVLWGSAGITVPWESYLQYGDTAMLREHYPAMVAYIDYLQLMIDPETGLIVDARLGDWLGPQDEQLGPDFLVTAYHVFDLEIVMRVAEILGRSQDAAKFRKLHRARKDFFNKTFVNDEKKTLGYLRSPSPEFRIADTQSSYAVGLALGAFNDANIPAMQRNLAAAVERENVDDRGVRRPQYSLMTGFIGTAWISEALSRGGHTDLAYKLLQNSRYPSWLYPVDQGATTIWERLNGYTVEEGFGGNNGMNSFNHYSFGAVGQWMMAHSLGIQRGEPGFKSFVLQPEPDPTGEMTWASGHYDSPYGRIASSWRLAGGMLDYTATVPPNTRATLYLPTRAPKSVQEGERLASESATIKFKRYKNGTAVYELPSGTYRFRASQ